MSDRYEVRKKHTPAFFEFVLDLLEPGPFPSDAQFSEGGSQSQEPHQNGSCRTQERYAEKIFFRFDQNENQQRKGRTGQIQEQKVLHFFHPLEKKGSE